MLVLVLIMLGGWYIWQKQTATSPVANLQDSSPASMLQYQDEYISFTYPAGWNVERQHTFTDDYGAHLVNMTAPVEANLKAADSSHAKLRLKMSILITKDAARKSCRQNCTVYHVDKMPLKSPEINGALVVSDWDSQGYPNTVEYTQSDVTEGQEGYDSGFLLDNKYTVRIYGGYVSADGVSGVRLSTTDSYWTSLAYGHLSNIIRSFTVKIK